MPWLSPCSINCSVLLLAGFNKIQIAHNDGGPHRVWCTIVMHLPNSQVWLSPFSLTWLATARFVQAPINPSSCAEHEAVCIVCEKIILETQSMKYLTYVHFPKWMQRTYMHHPSLCRNLRKISNVGNRQGIWTNMRCDHLSLCYYTIYQLGKTVGRTHWGPSY